MFVIKLVKYLIQAMLIYVFFIIIKIIGLTLARRFFSFLFNIIGPFIKSEQTVNNNLDKFLGSYNDNVKKNIKFKMWSNYGKTFVEYLFLNKFRNKNSHIEINGEEILDRIKKKIKQLFSYQVILQILS